MTHGDPGGSFFAYRLEAEGRSIAYTGDTEWTDKLIEAGAGLDLFIAEAYFYEKKVKLHLDLATLIDKLPRIQPGRLVLTHLSKDILNRLGTVDCKMAYDGKVIYM